MDSVRKIEILRFTADVLYKSLEVLESLKSELESEQVNPEVILKLLEGIEKCNDLIIYEEQLFEEQRENEWQKESMERVLRTVENNIEE